MAIAIQRYTEQWIPAVKAFNQRLSAGGIASEFHFPDTNIPPWLPKADGRRIYQEFYLATDGDAVRGAYILKFQDFSFAGEVRPVVYYHLPISEGTVNKAYSSVGVHMLRSALKAQPMLFCLGMGGFDRPLPRMLNATGWSLSAVPFFFKVNNAARFLRHVTSLRRTIFNQIVCDVAAWSGAGAMAINILQRIHAKRVDRSTIAEPISGFGEWTDILWQQCHARYTLIAARDRSTLDVLYPPGKNFLCIKVSRKSEILGWAVMLDTQMQNNKYFGDLRVGSIADCLASPENAAVVIKSAADFLQDRGVDLVVTNHSHAAWTEALKSTGFLQGPSNFILAASKSLAELIAPYDKNTDHSNEDKVYFMRGDGDGPVNL
ncbi:MAG: hypothetical protein M3O09_08210 [Acidobacteriota bacterium]|nr:hypothetical protein [Acidobacteriota bacterium]